MPDDAKGSTTSPNSAISAIAYYRYSPKPSHRESLDTIEVQEEICQRYCERHDIQIAVTLRDPLVSARQTPLFERPEGSKIPSLTAAGLKTVVCVRLDRIFRNAVDGLTTLALWNEQGVSLVLADQGGNSLNCGTATGKLLAATLLNFAEFEPNITSERTSASMLSKQARGQVMTSPRSLPWGWMLKPGSKISERGKPCEMIPSENERAHTRTFQKWLASGQSLSSIADTMNGTGHTCRGKPWTHQSVRRAADAKWE